MALTLPTAQDLESFWGDEADDLDEARATELIQLSANLLWLATDIDSDPEDPRLASLVKFAIMDMAINLFVSRDDLSEAYGTNQSERIGSYSYTKAYNTAAKNVSAGTPTGVMLFDRLVQYYIDQAFFGESTVSTEYVFRPGFVQLPLAVQLSQYFGTRDPSSRRGWYANLH